MRGLSDWKTQQKVHQYVQDDEKGKNLWWRWLDRFDSYYDRKFESDWQKNDKDFWDKLKYQL